MHSMKFPKKTPLAAAILMLAINNAADAAQTATYNAVYSTTGNFTMITPQQGTCGASYAAYSFGGANDVAFTWDGTLFTSASDYTGPGGASNATLASPSPFFGAKWTAHTVQIFGPGTYSFDTAQGGGNNESGTVTMTVGAGQLGAHMLFNWSGNNNIDVVNVWDMDTAFGPLMHTTATGSNPNPANNNTGTVFLLSSGDPDGDGVDGVPMTLGGPFQCYNANFNMKGPLTFTFNNKTGVALTTPTESDPITVSGFYSGGSTTTNYAGISVSGGEYAVSTDGGSTYGAYTSTAGTVTNGNKVKVRHTSSASNSTPTVTTLTIGLHINTFTSTTQAATCDTTDTTPDAFTFINKSDVALSTVTESDPITIAGICTGTTTSISVSGGEYAVSTDGGTTYGSYTSIAGTVTKDDKVKVRHTSAAANGTATNTALTIGGVSDTFTSTTTITTVVNTISVTADEPGKMPSGGCSISSQPDRAGNRVDWWLVAGFIAWLGMVVRRRRQSQN